MIPRGFLCVATGTVSLIIVGVTQASSIIADGNVSESTGITLGLVIGAIGLVAVGAWQLSKYVSAQESRLKRIEEVIAQLESPSEKRRH